MSKPGMNQNQQQAQEADRVEAGTPRTDAVAASVAPVGGASLVSAGSWARMYRHAQELELELAATAPPRVASEARTPETDAFIKRLKWQYSGDAIAVLYKAGDLARTLERERDDAVKQMNITKAAWLKERSAEAERDEMRASLEALEKERDEARAEFKKAAEWNRLCELEMKNLRCLVEGLEEELKQAQNPNCDGSLAFHLAESNQRENEARAQLLRASESVQVLEKAMAAIVEQQRAFWKDLELACNKALNDPDGGKSLWAGKLLNRCGIALAALTQTASMHGAEETEG